MTRFRFLPEQHLRTAADFERTYARRCRGSDAQLLIYAERNGTQLTRIGLSVSRKHGGAVQRGRRKRILREAFRLNQHEMPLGLDLILIPQQGTEPNLELWGKSLVELARRLDRKLGREAAP